MVTIKDNYVLDEEKLDVILSNLEHNLKTLFENDKEEEVNIEDFCDEDEELLLLGTLENEI